MISATPDQKIYLNMGETVLGLDEEAVNYE